ARHPNQDVTEDPPTTAAGMSQAEYARHRGVTRQAISAAIKDGRLRAPALLHNGRIDPVLADAMLAEPRTPPHRAGGTMASARAKREEANARLAELALAEKEGRLLPRERVEAAATELAALIRGRLADRRQAVIEAVARAENPVSALRALDDALCLELAREAEARLAPA
ncbi:MAG: hypothetical protein N2688_00245, partial [Burkholderiaceae bacterium]|nr:hypothetical protein [Burkholderiaceae bacterium]